MVSEMLARIRAWLLECLDAVARDEYAALSAEHDDLCDGYADLKRRNADLSDKAFRLAMKDGPPKFTIAIARDPVVRFVEPLDRHPSDYGPAAPEEFWVRHREVRLQAYAAAARVDEDIVVDRRHREHLVNSLARAIGEKIAQEAIPSVD
jgi:hypothetical protein